MDVASVSAPPSATLAGVGLRLVSSIIDLLVVIIPTMILASVFTLGGAMASTAAEDDGVLALVGAFFGYLAAFVISVGYYLYAWAIGTSLGMKLLGLRMVRADSGEAPGFGRALVRLVVAYVSNIPFALGYFWAIWDSKKQTWHDKAAGTIVIKV